MNKIFALRGDKSAVSTLVIATVVAIVLIVAAVGVYFVLSNNGNDDSDDRISGPGTTYEYIVTGNVAGLTISGSATLEIIGQNSNQYLIEQIYDVSLNTGDALGALEVPVVYNLIDKSTGVPPEVKKLGSTTLDTIDGNKNVDIWEFVISDINEKVYVDPDSKIIYQITDTISVMYTTLDMSSKLSAKTIVKQDKYEPSSDIGVIYYYSIEAVDGSHGTATAEIIADAVDGYGVAQTTTLYGESATEYILANTYGLPANAEDMKYHTTKGTEFGVKEVDLYLSHGASYDEYYYVGSDDGFVYLISVYIDDEYFALLNLTSF